MCSARALAIIPRPNTGSSETPALSKQNPNQRLISPTHCYDRTVDPALQGTVWHCLEFPPSVVLCVGEAIFPLNLPRGAMRALWRKGRFTRWGLQRRRL